MAHGGDGYEVCPPSFLAVSRSFQAMTSFVIRQHHLPPARAEAPSLVLPLLAPRESDFEERTTSDSHRSHTSTEGGGTRCCSAIERQNTKKISTSSVSLRYTTMTISRTRVVHQLQLDNVSTWSSSKGWVLESPVLLSVFESAWC